MSSLFHPALTHCRRLFVKNYDAMVSIGVYDAEKSAKQRVLINVDVFIPLVDSTPKEDQLTEVVDYDFIVQAISTRLAQGHIQLQETLCDDIAQTLLAHEKVVAVRITSEKCDAYTSCDAVGVEIFRFKQIP
jgi:dihydroneopterin aldolase